MQLVLPFEHMAKAAQYMEPSVFEYVREGEIESFESFEKFDFLAFDWYDVHSERTEDYKNDSYALAGGVDAKTLSGILGHTNASFTLDTYTHVTTDMQRNASTIVGSFMDEIMLEGDDTNR